MFLENDDHVETWFAATRKVECLRIMVVYHEDDENGNSTPELRECPYFGERLYTVAARRVQANRAGTERAERDSPDLEGIDTDGTMERDSPVNKDESPTPARRKGKGKDKDKGKGKV